LIQQKQQEKKTEEKPNNFEEALLELLYPTAYLVVSFKYLLQCLLSVLLLPALALLRLLAKAVKMQMLASPWDLPRAVPLWRQALPAPAEYPALGPPVNS
jgi:hypothetical protein